MNIIWYDKLKKIRKYIDENDKLPSINSENKEIKQLRYWVNSQQYNHKNLINNMKNDEIYNLWSEFIEEYNDYFKSRKEKWIHNLNKLKKYIDKNKNLPKQYSTNKKDKKLAYWINTQKYNYKNVMRIMNDNEIYKLWEEFINQYNNYFKTNKYKWKHNFIKVIYYINKYNKLPNQNSDNIEIRKLAYWINTQKYNYKHMIRIMKNDEIYKLWENFIKEYL
jgi:hypothetical protein